MKTPKEFNEEIIKITAFLREKADLGQEQIADALGIPRNRYAKYEVIYPDRTTIIPLNLIQRFCEIVGVSIEYLITGKEHPVVDAYLHASPDDRRIVDKMLNINWEAPKKTGT